MPTGRPSPIDAIVAYRDIKNADGETIGQEPITVAERITTSLRAGNYFEPSALAAGITKETAYEWLRVAGRARLRTRGRTDTTTDWTDHERKCVDFSDAVVGADAQHEVRSNLQLDHLANGYPIEKTVEQYGLVRGKLTLVAKTVTKQTLPPNAQVLEWRLTRRHPDRYGDRIEVSTPGALDEADYAHSLLDGMVSLLDEMPKPNGARGNGRKLT